jgi:energy-converting hydrogenase Eha subunit F
MNQDWNEPRLNQLFHDLKQEDERRAPPFTSVWIAARARTSLTRRPRGVARFALVSGMACALLVVVAGLLVVPPRESDQNGIGPASVFSQVAWGGALSPFQRGGAGLTGPDGVSGQGERIAP